MTRRGVAVLVACPLLYLLGELIGSSFFRALAGACLGALAVAWYVTTRPATVEVYREVYPGRVERGRPTMALLQLRNQTAKRQPPFVAEDLLGGSSVKVRIRELAPQATVTYRYELPTDRRGRLEVGPLTLHRHDPLGLMRGAIANGPSTVVWVHPRRHRVRGVNLGSPRHHHDGRSSPDPLAGSADLRQIREYRRGDEIRHVHWKAVARTGKLMVRDFDDPSEPCLTVALDNRAGAMTPDQFEEAVELAASFACSSLASKYRTRLVTTCDDIDFETHGDARSIPTVLDLLAEVGQHDSVGTVPQVQGGAVVVVAGRAHRHLTAGLDVEHHSAVLFDMAGASERGPAANAAVRSVVRAPSAADAVRRWNAVVH